MTSGPLFPVLHLGPITFELSAGRLVKVGRSPRSDFRVGVEDRSVSRTTVNWFASQGIVHVVNVCDSKVSVEIDGGTHIQLEPGSAEQPLPSGSTGELVISADSTYRIPFALSGGRASGIPGAASDVDEDDSTTTANNLAVSLGLTPDEVRVLAAFAALRIANPRLGESAVPTSASVAERLGLSYKRLENLLNSLAVKLASRIPGLLGSNARRATTRRQLMVSFAIERSIVTARDVEALPPEGG